MFLQPLNRGPGGLGGWGGGVGGRVDGGGGGAWGLGVMTQLVPMHIFAHAHALSNQVT